MTVPAAASPGKRPFRFNVFADELPSRSGWQKLACRVEDLGYFALVVGDHLGLASALPALVSAADVTSLLRVGTRVLNTELFHPLRLAQEAATVDRLTDGRLELGLGTGWSRREHELLGLPYRPAAERAGRLRRAIAAMTAAWSEAGEPGGDCHSTVGPPPVQQPHPPLMIGGHGDAVLTVAAEHADLVGFTGATVRGDRYVPTAVSLADLGERVAFVRAAAGPRFERIELGLKVVVVATDADAETVAGRLAAASGFSAEVIRESPFAFVGSPAEVADKLRAVRDALGVTSYDIPAAAIDDVARVADLLL